MAEKSVDSWRSAAAAASSESVPRRPVPAATVVADGGGSWRREPTKTAQPSSGSASTAWQAPSRRTFDSGSSNGSSATDARTF